MPPRNPDSGPLLFMSDIEQLTGWKNDTVKHYSTASARHREAGTATDWDMPAPVRKVRRKLIKSDGQPLVVWTPQWRSADILAWLRVRGVAVINANATQ